jgi:gamma-glutamyl hercynylcysteine S-oxide hydrolase
MRTLRDTLSDASYSRLLGVTDSETIFALLLDQLHDTKVGPEEDGGALAEATVETVRSVSITCTKLGVPASLNVGVTDGEAMVFVRYSTEGPGNSLYFVEDGRTFPNAVVVASERLDGDANWQQVPDRHLLVADHKGVTLRPL